MKAYILVWTYYGADGAEQGRMTIEARSPEDAEGRFYRNNRPFWRSEYHMGYVVESVEEAQEI